MNRLLPHRFIRATLCALFLGGAVTLAGCDILEVNNPNNLIEEDLSDPRSVPAMANGAEASVTRALGAVLSSYSTATDELTWIGSRDAWNQLDIGQLSDPANEFSDAAYPYVAEARWATQEYITRMEGFNETGDLANPTDLIRTYLYGAIIYTAIADMYDNFAFSDRREPGPAIGPDNMNSLYDTALGYVNSGISLNNSLSDPSAALGAALLGMRARIHYSKAVWEKLNPVDTSSPLVNNGEAVTAAQEALDAMSEDFVFELEVTGAQPDLVVGDLSMAEEVNARAELGFGERFVQPNEDGTYTPNDTDDSDGLSAVIYEDIVTGEVHAGLRSRIDAFVAEGQYGDITVISAREMHLILAEAALAGNTSLDFETHINAIRSLDELADYTGQVPALDVLQQARTVNLFLQGRRLADLYRFEDESSPEWTNRADPVGTFLPIAITELRANPEL